MRRILIIDDEDDIREVTALTLRATTSWHVETAGSDSEGILCTTTSRPDAILLDFSMPGMDGPAPLRAAQCIPALASVPVLFLTARAYSGHVAGLGAAGVVAKPFDPRTLGRQIASVLCWS